MSCLSAKSTAEKAKTEALAAVAKKEQELWDIALAVNLQDELSEDLEVKARVKANLYYSERELEVLNAIKGLRADVEEMVEEATKGGYMPSQIKSLKEELEDEKVSYVNSLKELGLL